MAYYLVHSMGAHGDYLGTDRVAARNFGEAARRAGVRRIVYLGGLATGDEVFSKHLESRIETGQVLRESGVPVVEFRASVVIGSGSLSFELIRALVERLPVMICPRWVSTLAQPIGIDDVLAYLAAALQLPDSESRTFEIGGADQASYGDVMRGYARQRGLKRVMISVPLLTPRLSSLWLGLVTPVYARVGRELIAGLKNRSVVTDPTALAVFPIRPIGLREAIGRAIRYEDRAFALTRWSDARSSGGATASPADTRFGGRLIDRRQIHVAVGADRAFVPIAKIGGNQGWYYATWLWRIRGAIDLLMGGVGMRRGRRDPNAPAVGDTLDFWRVEAYKPGRRLRLAAEMKCRAARGSSSTSAGCRRRSRPPDRRVRAGRIVRAALLVCALPVHAVIFGGHAARDRPARSVTIVTGIMAALIGLGTILTALTLVWMISVRLRDASIADICWGLGFVLLAWLYCLLSPTLTPRSWLVAALMTLWGTRLSLHIFRRHRGKGEDPRYQAMRASQGPAFWWRSLFTVFWLQGAILWFVALPLLVAVRAARPAALTAVDGLGIVLFAVGFGFEVVGDYQLERFKAEPSNRGPVLDRGSGVTRGIPIIRRRHDVVGHVCPGGIDGPADGSPCSARLS